MRDYEELVKRLRNCVSDTVEDCVGCPYQGGYKGTYCMNGLVTEAADAIEELSKPKWISVTERLPEESEGLNLHEDMMIHFVSVWCCDVNTGTISVRNRFQHKITGIQFLDQNIQDTDWHWSESWWEPTHWMPIVPLPEPPKEEKR